MTCKEFIYMKKIELDLLKLKGGEFDKTPHKDFIIKHARGYVESIPEQREFRYREDQARDEHGRFTDEGGSSASSSDNGGNDLTDGSESVRLDSNGIPFCFPNIHLPYKEYKSFTDQVGRNWYSKYEGKELCQYKTTQKTYYFENRGIGDYNIYAIKEHKK